jgi:hypothetical protein
MENYLGEFAVKLKDTPFAAFGPDDWALYFIGRYGGIDGAHHKQWLVDQVARILNGAAIHVVEARWGGGHAEYRVTVGASDKYAAWVAAMKSGEDGPETYDWDEGVPP